MEGQEKTFNHQIASVADKIALLSELQHIENHAIRSAVSLYDPDDLDKDDWVFYATVAKQAKDLRRAYQQRNFGQLSEYDWCLCKAAARLRQLAYETQESDYAMLKLIDDLVDTVWGNALDMDLSSCYACREDKAVIESE